LRSVVVEPLSDMLARLAGEALTKLPSAQTIDAIVMASASCRRGELVYTGDIGDFAALRQAVPQFSAVRIERA
jgi:hypothetical protein